MQMGEFWEITARPIEFVQRIKALVERLVRLVKGCLVSRFQDAEGHWPSVTIWCPGSSNDPPSFCPAVSKMNKEAASLQAAPSAVWTQPKRSNTINNQMRHEYIKSLYTLYLALLTTRLPSRSQLTEGLGLPKAVQVKVMLPPSLASTYWGGVSVNVGGAEEKNKQRHVRNVSKRSSR